MQATKKISIIMYHYVRNFKNSPYPNIKGLSVDLFQEQLKYIMKYYQIISMEDLIAAVKFNQDLPPNALLLTFDDAYIDHFTNVFPILNKLSIQGSFFPTAKAIIKHEVLDVNKIHFILSSAVDKTKLVEELFILLDEFREAYSLEDNQYYFKKIAVSDRLDCKEVIFIKRMLQRDLPEELRRKITKILFHKYVTKDEEDFFYKLYMDIKQIKYLKENGMFIGAHGFTHRWLGTLNTDSQEKEIDLSLKFLRQLGCSLDNWVMCYPFGSYNNSLINILEKKKCAIGLTSEVGIADLNRNNPFLLPRLDTIDLPNKSNVAPNNWTLEVMQNNNLNKK